MLATGGSFTGRDFVKTSFSHAGFNWDDHARLDERHPRPTEVSRDHADTPISRPGGAQEKHLHPG